MSCYLNSIINNHFLLTNVQPCSICSKTLIELSSKEVISLTTPIHMNCHCNPVALILSKDEVTLMSKASHLFTMGIQFVSQKERQPLRQLNGWSTGFVLRRPKFQSQHLVSQQRAGGRFRALLGSTPTAKKQAPNPRSVSHQCHGNIKKKGQGFRIPLIPQRKLEKT